MRKCTLCGSKYEYCPNCSKDRSKPMWYKLFDGENCHNIFNALNDYKFKLISKEEAQERLAQCDLNITLNDYYRGELEAIMAKPKRGSRVKMPIVDEVIPEEVISEVVEIIETHIEEANEEPDGVVIAE